MILYLDTSALVKLYVEEEASDEVRNARDRAQVVATSRLSYVEARAALARARREGRISSGDHRRVANDLDRDWESYFAIEVTERLVRRAAELAECHPLRAYDAVHLASALILRERVRMDVAFLCFDKRLAEAAKVEGFVV